MAQYTGTPADDSYTGTPDADIIVSGGGKDVLDGADGDDRLVLDAPLKAGSALAGGSGTDTLALQNFATRPLLFSFLSPQGVPLSRHDLRGSTVNATIERVAFESVAGVALALELGSLAPGTVLVGGAGYDALVLDLAAGSGPLTAPTFAYTDWQTSDRAYRPGDLVQIIAPAGTVLNGSAHAGVQLLEVAGGARTINGSDDMDLILGGLNGGPNQLRGNGGDDTIAFIRTLGFTTGADGAIASYDSSGGSTISGTIDGGEGFDFLALGGPLLVEGFHFSDGPTAPVIGTVSFSGIEGIYMAPAYSQPLAANITGSLQERTGLSGLNSSHLAQLPGDLLFDGVGQLSIDITDNKGFDGSGFRFEAGSDITFTINGRDEDDVLIGTASDDDLFGNAGDDVITGGAGDDYIGGFQGQDVAVFSGNRADYTVTRIGESSQLVTGPEGRDAVVGCEIYRFADGDYVWDWFASELVRPGTPATGQFRMFAGDDFVGTIGGSGTIIGTNGAQNVGIYRGGGDISFDPSFNRGNDLIRMPGRASDYAATAQGSNARLTDDLATYSIPAGAGTSIWFTYWAANLAYSADAGGITLAGSKLGSSPVTLTDSDAISPSPPSAPQGLATLYLGDDAAVAVGGNFRIFGTSGEQRITWRDGDIVLDPSFNRGGDVLTVDAAAQAIAAYRSGSNVVLVWGDDTAAIPVGAGLMIDFDGPDERLLRADGAGVWIGDQQITATSAETALNLSAFQSI